VSGQRVDVGDVALHVEASGHGPPLALLHGFTGCAATLAETAEPLAKRFRTLCIDLVGHGASDAPDDPAAYSFDACTRQVADVLAALEARPAHLLGYSMGGRVALGLCVAHPASVRSTVLVGARAGFADPEERARRRLADDALAASIEGDGIEKFVDRWMALPLIASQRRRGEAFLEAARRQRLQGRASALARSLRGMGAGAQPPLHDRLAAVQVPVLLAVGAEDEHFQREARDLAARLPRARVAIVPEAGHAAHLENPAAFHRVARDFLAEVEDEPDPTSTEPAQEESACRT
jgi:2-succinyl-6-hydroxy-2,4-cyclohexadiene-1-carboxylate synthase